MNSKPLAIDFPSLEQESEPPTPHEIVRSGLVNVTQAGQFLGVGKSMIYQLMDQGELPYVKIGSARRIPINALQDFATSNLRGG